MIRNITYIAALLLTLPGIAALNEQIIFDAYGNQWSGNYEQAVQNFSTCIEEAPMAEYLLQRGICYYQLKQYDQAIADLKAAKAAQLNEASLWLARCYAHTGHDFNCITELQDYLPTANSAIQKAIQKDTLYSRLHPTTTWLMLWQNTLAKSNDLLDEVEFLIRKNRFEEAHAILESAMQNKATDHTLHAKNAALYALEENYQMSVYEINQALDYAPDAEYLQQKANYLSRLGQYDKAVAVLTEVLNETPYHFDTRKQIAQLAYSAQRFDLARSELNRCLKYSNDPQLQLLSAKVYQAQGNYLEALRCLNPLLEKDSTNYAALSTRGITYYGTNTYKRASYDLSMSLDLQPDDAEANYYMALTQKALGYTSEACFFMKRAQRLGEAKAHEWVLKNCK